jgi:hypothetical protein
MAPRLRAALGLVRKLTLAPEEVGADDLGAILSAGVSEDAVRDAIYVCFAFNLIDRVSDALGFDLLDEKGTVGGTGPAQGRVQASGTAQAAGPEPGLVSPALPNLSRERQRRRRGAITGASAAHAGINPSPESARGIDRVAAPSCRCRAQVGTGSLLRTARRYVWRARTAPMAGPRGYGYAWRTDGFDRSGAFVFDDQRQLES